jgi:glycosyltransferase involved in cell wall biosynthesis
MNSQNVAPPALSLVVPCFNEADCITRTVDSIITYMRETEPGLSYELLLVNDGSTDETLQVIEKLKTNYPIIKIVSYTRNMGRGYALKQGFNASQGEYVITLDADLSYDLDHIKEMLQPFRDNPKIDVVVVGAYHKDGVVQGVPFKRKLLSKTANHILRGFFENKITTITCVVRAYRGDLIRNLHFLENGKEIHLEILRKLNLMGAQIVEIPGRLIWKESTTGAPRRSNNLNISSSAKRHLEYALMIRPTLVIKLATVLLLLIGVYEAGVIAYLTYALYMPEQPSFAHNFWLSLRSTYNNSPHSFFIAFGSLILGTQALSTLLMLKTSKLQQEEIIQHLLAVLDKEER